MLLLSTFNLTPPFTKFKPLPFLSLTSPHHTMGNSTSHRHPDNTGKVILSNGAVFNYDEPLTVAELMMEHPQQVVVEFQPVINGKKPTPLPADKKLDMKKLYIMLPVRKGKPALSSEQAQKLLMNTNSILKSKALLSYTGFLPLFVRICPAAGRQNDVVLNGKDCMIEEESKSDYFSDVLEGRPEFLSKQISGKGWKPSLDTIKEKTMKAKVRHWLISM